MGGLSAVGRWTRSRAAWLLSALRRSDWKFWTGTALAFLSLAVAIASYLGDRAQRPPAGPTASPTVTPPTAAPLRVESKAFAPGCHPPVVVTGSPDSVAPQQTYEQVDAFIDRADVSFPSRTVVRLTAIGTGPEAVVLQDLAVDIVERVPLGNVFNLYVYDGSTCYIPPVRRFQVDLAAIRPVVLPPAGLADARDSTVKFPFVVRDTEPEVIEVEATAPPGMRVVWRLRLRWTAGAASGETLIDDRGKDIRSSGSQEKPSVTVRVPP